MSAEAQELLRTFEQLPDAQRVAVTNFARDLLGREPKSSTTMAVDRWLVMARGAATTGITTDELMAMSRGEA